MRISDALTCGCSNATASPLALTPTTTIPRATIVPTMLLGMIASMGGMGSSGHDYTQRTIDDCDAPHRRAAIFPMEKLPGPWAFDPSCLIPVVLFYET